MSDSEQPKLELEYPCQWEYRVIGGDEAAMRAAIEEVMEGRSHEVMAGGASAGGKWLTLIVTLEVVDEEERLALYEGLRNHEAIKIVL
ncbi:MAG: cytoplasmic protein [Phycisphaerae bacterium]|nr:cytoplasmic protein [Phycisphaerae bacterium]|tara:strand:- start:513 stop:776 length:264 start_codon:yes stop_codon:yes gene_type:complete